MKTTKILIVTRRNQLKVGDKVRFKNKQNEWVYDEIATIYPNSIEGKIYDLTMVHLEKITQNE